jgi:hypothetical protein
MVDPPRELVVGALAAAATLAVVLVAGHLVRRTRGRRSLVVESGVVFVVGSLLGTRDMGYLVATVTAGSAVLLVAGIVGTRARPLGYALVPIGAWLVLGDDAASLSSTGRVVGAIGASVVALLVAAEDRANRDTVVLLALSAFGIALCVPDTEVAFVAAGAVAVAALPALVGLPVRLGIAAAAATGVLLWATTTGGAGRDASIAGAVASMGVLVVEPLVNVVRSSRVRATTGTVRVARFGVHAGAVIIGSRAIGLSDDVAWASAAATVLLVVVGAGVVAIDQLAREVAPSPMK